jgi:hypothetical protein
VAESFNVGDVVELVSSQWVASDCLEYLGQEGEIVALDTAWFFRGEPMHHVRMRDGMDLEVAISNMRKRRPPQDWANLCNLTDMPREVEHV